MTKPSERSRELLPKQGAEGSDSTEPKASHRSPKDKKHKSLDEVRRTGRQSDQG
jgi:hypothetical protein